VSSPRNCTVCNNPTVCEKHGLLRPIMGRTQISCTLEDDKPAAFLYRLLLQLADQQGVNISELM
jgi:hypothetical protein